MNVIIVCGLNLANIAKPLEKNLDVNNLILMMDMTVLEITTELIEHGLDHEFVKGFTMQNNRKSKN